MTTTEAGTGQRTVWELDPKHTLVEFAAKHMMFTTVKGHFTGVEGTIYADESNPANSSVEVTIDADSITTGVPDRDNHLRSPDFLDVQNNPQITYKSTKVEPKGDNKLKITGDLTIRGITRPVVLDAEITGRGKTPYGQEASGFAATTSINRKDWGLNWNVALEAGGVLVSDTLKIEIEAEAIKQG